MAAGLMTSSGYAPGSGRASKKRGAPTRRKRVQTRKRLAEENASQYANTRRVLVDRLPHELR